MEVVKCESGKNDIYYKNSGLQVYELPSGIYEFVDNNFSLPSFRKTNFDGFVSEVFWKTKAMSPALSSDENFFPYMSWSHKHGKIHNNFNSRVN